MRRSIYAVLISAFTTAGFLGGGCAQTGHSNGFPGEDGGGGAGGSGGGGIVLQPEAGPGPSLESGIAAPVGTCTKGLTAIVVSPATTSVSVTYSATLPTTNQPFTAQGTFMDGSTSDVTTCAGWTTSSPSIATISQTGAFSTDAAGQFTVTATSDGVNGTAVITIMLTGTATSGGITTTDLDGTPGGTAPTIAYPFDQALFPFHFGDLAFQMVPSSASQTEARISFQGDAIALDLYAPCTPITGAAIAGACSVAIPADLEASLAGASEATNLTETVRLSAPGGANLSESSPISARWSSVSLPGTVYYWSAPPAAMNGQSEIRRVDLTTPGTPPEVYFSYTDIEPNQNSTPPYPGYSDMFSGGWCCIGCHSITQDGKYMGVTMGGASISSGGGNGSFFALVDIATRAPLAAAITTDAGQFLPDGFATFTTFAPDDNNMVQELQGQLFLRTYTAASTPPLATAGALFAGSTTESLTDPYWSAKGDLLAFASWVPTGAPPYDPKDLNGNEVIGAQIWTSAVAGTTFATPNLLVPRQPGLTEYYPAISDDSALVAFDESSCAGPNSPTADGYGASPCDGYDDPSARLRVVEAAGGTAVNLDLASGVTSNWPTSDVWTNSWSRFSPTHGTFQGKSLYWLTFSSRRPYGATLAGSSPTSATTPPATWTSPQIWFAAVVVDPTKPLSGDPSYAPVWLPLQNSATPETLYNGTLQPSISASGTIAGNHSAEWVYTFVPYVPPANMMPPQPPPQ
jgi:hypothetical protein